MNYASVFAGVLALLAVHLYIAGLALGSLWLVIWAIPDALGGIVLGSKSDSNVGHGAVVVGLVVLLAAMFTLIF